MIENIHPALNELLDACAKRGHVTFDQINALLPDEYVDADRVDELLAHLDVRRIVLVDNRQVPKDHLPKHAVQVIAEAELWRRSPRRGRGGRGRGSAGHGRRRGG